MTYKEVAQIVGGVPYGEGTIPYAYYAFPEDNPENPAPPFICYYYGISNDMIANNINYQKIRQVIIELYTDNKDFETEKAVEDRLAAYEIVYSKTEDYIGSERLYMVTYTAEIVITEENNNG